MLVKQLIKHLEGFGLDTTVAAMIWLPEDVLSLVEPGQLTDEDADWILEDIDHHQDASLGITWDTLQYYVDEYLRENELEKKGIEGKGGEEDAKV